MLSIDGALANEVTASGTLVSTTGAFAIGNDPNSLSTDGFSGGIDDVSIYDAAVAPSTLMGEVPAGRHVVPWAQSVKAVFTGAVASTPTYYGRGPSTNQFLSGGNLASSVELTFGSAPGAENYYLYISDDPTEPWNTLYSTRPITSGVSLDLNTVVTELGLRHVSTNSAMFYGAEPVAHMSGQEVGLPTLYFTIVAMSGGLPRGHRPKLTSPHDMGTASATFCAPQIFFVGGDNSGDTEAILQGGSSDPLTATAAYYEAKLGAQVTVFPWNIWTSTSGTNGGNLTMTGFSRPDAGTLYLAASEALQTAEANIPLVLMGESSGGNAAIQAANDITGTVAYLDLFDPVFNIYPNGAADGTGSIFTAPGDATHVYDWYGSASAEAVFNGDPFPVGPVSPAANVVNRQFTKRVRGLTPYEAGLTHVSQATESDVLSFILSDEIDPLVWQVK